LNCQTLESMSLDEFRNLDKKDRLKLLQHIEDRPWAKHDSIFYKKEFDRFFKVCSDQKDGLGKVWLLYRMLNVRSHLNLTLDQEEALYHRCIKEAKDNNAEVELIVFSHYQELFQFNKRKGKMEVCYLYLLEEYRKMKALGFEKFKPFQVARLLFHSGNFFLEIEEYDQALASLLDAEKYLNELTTHKNITVIILNAIQSIYQRRNENDKGLIYAQKILNHIDKVGHTDEKYYNLWKGLVRIDMAAMKLKLNQIRESEVLATEGHQIIGGQPSEYILGSEAEFDALIVLIDIKIKLNKYEEAVKLIQRAQQLYQIYGDREGAYFKRIALYEHQIAVAKYEHDWKEVVELQNLLTPVQDSFERKNDIRKQESLKQQNKIEQLRGQLALSLKEKQLNTWIRNASLLLLMLSATLFYLLFTTVKNKKKLKEAELENAQHELSVLTKNLLEKSNILEQMKTEMAQISDETEKSQYLEKLSNYSILKDEDWHEFKLIFEKVYPNFIHELKQEYEDITPAEIRLLVLEKLNFSQDAMANNLGVSKQAIYQTKYRLRKKYSTLG
jgi:DNA-binding transcriptional regulator YiaG